MDFFSLNNYNKKSHFNVVLFFMSFLVEKIMWPLGFPLLKEEKIKSFFLFFLTLDSGLFFLKDRNLLRKRKIGLST